MKIYTNLINPLMYGNWILRNTNDISLKKSLNYIQIQEEPLIKLKTIKQNGLIGKKISRTAYINNINYIGNNTYSFILKYSSKSAYSYSFLGIEIPEIKTNSIIYDKEKKFLISIFYKTLLIEEDLNNPNYLFYIFDLQISDIKYPNTETNINIIIITQLLSILFSLFISRYL